MSFNCDHCDSAFTSSRSLGFHIRKCNNGQEITTSLACRYQCPHCPFQTYTNSQVLSGHLSDKHKAIKPHPPTGRQHVMTTNTNELNQDQWCSMTATENEEQFEDLPRMNVAKNKAAANYKRSNAYSNEFMATSINYPNKRNSVDLFDEDFDMKLAAVDENPYHFDVDYNPFKESVIQSKEVDIEDESNDSGLDQDCFYLDHDGNDEDANGEVIVVNSVQEAVDAAIGTKNDCTDLINIEVPAQINRNDSIIRQSCQVELLKLLESTNAPLHLFDDIMRWAQKSCLTHDYDFSQHAPQRKQLIGNLIQQNGFSNLKPKTIQLEIPYAGQTVKVIMHDIQQSIHSLLTDVN
ncbi:MAG: hypothetical protein ACRCXZ_00600 [Patescibacteria group bacterium]